MEEIAENLQKSKLKPKPKQTALYNTLGNENCYNILGHSDQIDILLEKEE